MTLNPLGPHDALKHHFTSLKTELITTEGFRKNISMKLVHLCMVIFLYFFTHIKSSLSTTSRELRQQFGACSV